MENPQATNTGVVPPNPFSGGVLNPALITADFVPPTTNVGQQRPTAPNGEIPRSIQDMIHSGQQMGDQLKSSITGASEYGRNQFYYSTPRAVNKNDFERYYEHPAYDRLGYSPWRDNEKLYNDNSSGWADFRRAAAMWPTLAWTGLKSGVHSWGDIVKGRPFAEDVNAAKDFQRVMEIGSSSRKGVGGFMTNTWLNSGYTFGVMGEMLGEEVALAAATAFTGGEAAPATLPAMGARVMSGLGKIGKSFEVVRGLGKAVAEMKDINVAKNFWSAARKTGEFLNPLQNTTRLLKDSDLTNMATGKLFGAFYMDVRDINFALSEGKLEGGSAYLDETQRLSDDFYKKHGRSPDSNELNEIMEISKKAAYATTLVNLPAIYYTNKITFENLFKGFRPLNKVSEEFLTAAGSKIGFNAKAAAKGLDPFSMIENNLKNTAKAFLNPKTYAKAGLNYFKGNLSEGLQENIQDVISGAAKDYYTGVYNNPGKQGMDDVMGSITHNLSAAFSAQGLETFMGGFVMGSLVHPITSLPGWTTAGYHKFFKPEEYQKYQEAKNKYTTETVGRLNEMYKDPLKFFGSGLINTGAQTDIANKMHHAEQSADQKSWQDLKDASVYEHIWTALDTGTFDHFQERLGAIKDMDLPAINEAFNTENGQEIMNVADKMAERAQKIKEGYDTWKDKTPNPFNPKKFKKDSPEYIDEAISSRAWDLAQKHAVFMSYSFDRTLGRMKDILQQANTSKPLEKIDSHDFTLLFDPGTINSEVNLLKTEIKGLADITDHEAKKILTQKKKRLEKLTEYQDNLEKYQKALGSEELTKRLAKAMNATPEEVAGVKKSIDKDKEKSLKDLQKSYTKYLRHLAATKGDYFIDSKATSAFDKIKDFYDLNSDAENLSQVVNMFSDPEGFAEHFHRNTQFLRQLYDNKKDLIEDGIKKTIEKKETNSLLNQLYEKGVVMDADDLEAYLKDYKMPDHFYDIVNKIAINKDDPKYNELVALLQNHEKATTNAPAAEEPISDEIYNNFVDKGEISNDILQSIADKVKIHSALSERENAILADKTAEINKLISASAPEEKGKDISTATAWADLPASLRSKLEPLWEIYKRENLQDVEEFEMERLRQNWLATTKPSEMIANYNLDNKLKSAKLPVSQETPELRSVTLPEGKKLEDLSISDIGSLLKRLRERNAVPGEDPQHDLRQLDIQDLEDYLVRRRSIAPQSKTAKALEIVDRINQMQKAVQGRSEDNQFYMIKGEPYNRVTTVISRIAAEYTGSKEFVYPNMSRVIELYTLNQMQNASNIESFMASFKAQNFKEFNERKYDELEKALKENNSLETVRTVVNDLAYDESRKVGNVLDGLIRNFLQDEPALKPDSMSQESYDALIERLNEIRDNILDKNLTVLANNIVVYDPEIKVAGEIDVLAVDKNGDMYIYDIKSSRKSNWDVYEDTRNLKSNKIKHQLQVSAYGNLLYNSYGIQPKGYGIIPLEVTYDHDGNIETLSGHKTIKLDYLPDVEEAVPRKGETVKPKLADAKPEVVKKTKEVLPETEPETYTQKDVETLINTIENLSQLEPVGKKLQELFAKGKIDVPGKVVEVLFEHRRLQIVKNLDPESLKKDEVLIMNTPTGPELYSVIAIEGNNITFGKLNAAGEQVTFNKDEVVTKFEGRWTKNMETPATPEPDKIEKKLMDESADAASKLLSDKTRVQQIADEAEKDLDSGKAKTTLFNNLDC